MYYCFSKKELIIFINYILNKDEIKDDNLKQIIDNSIYWLDEIGFANYLFALILEKNRKTGINCFQIIERIFEETDIYSMDIHEMDTKFIEFIMKRVSNYEYSLEEDIIDIQTKIKEYDFKETFRN